mgnify:CR=1 FL=1
MADKNNEVPLNIWISSVLSQIKDGVSGYKIYDKIPINFEVGIEASRNIGTKTNGEIGIKVLSFLSLNASGDTDKTQHQTAYNKIAFTINLEDCSPKNDLLSSSINSEY